LDTVNMVILKKTVLLHVASLLIHSGNPNCYRGERTCCIGYYWNEKEHSCKECELGHFGQNCSKLCRYPSYGKGCQNMCTCPETLCVPAIGCVEIDDCAVGYFGLNCVKHCRYPNYGKGCQKKCACLEAFCVPTIGCVDANKENESSMKNKTATFEITTHRSEKEDDVFSTSQNKKNNITNMTISIAVIGVLVLMLIVIALIKVFRKKKREVDKTLQLQMSAAPVSLNNRNTSRLSESNTYDIIPENGQTRDRPCLNVNPLSDFPDDTQKKKYTASASNAGNIYLDTCQSSSSRESNHFYSPL
ncbi:multiple epidermal growth factor-like domains protein 10, partial [Saccostrea cucullata]|uniref:multiple epidermal growth factor-like domains protein 10 n=1 Tax=Saccostrea cuccullata TaxID=36930 RepID=UPI002ED65274